MSVWDDPDLQQGGEFVEFNQIGDGVSGTIQVVRTHTFDDGKKVPQLLLVTDEGEERTLTAGQVRLKATLVEQRPEPGDHLRVTLTNIEKRNGGKTLKHFDVQVIRGAGAQPVQQPVAQPVAQYPAVQPPVYAQPVAAPQPVAAQPQPVPVAAPPGVDPAQAAAALAALTPEQRAQLGLG